MKQALKIVSVLIVLIIGMGNACADPWRGRGERDTQRDERQVQRQEQYGRSQYEQGGRASHAAPEAPRSRNKMTPEERRVLRQQIHDAGREVYPPNR